MNSCRFFSNAKLLAAHHSLQQGGAHQVWDIEDLVTLGAKVGGCPYYAARTIAETADIVFTPYNYLISPEIRKAIDIQIDGAVVIIDEAHNIEGITLLIFDCASEAGSLELNEPQLVMAMQELQSLIDKGHNDDIGHYKLLKHLIDSVGSMITLNATTGDLKGGTLFKTFDQKTLLFSGEDAIKKLNEYGLLPQKFVSFNLVSICSIMHSLRFLGRKSKIAMRNLTQHFLLIL